MANKKTNLAAMAWRNLWRNRRRTAVTLSSIAFGILLAVIFTGIGDASYTDMINLAARMGSGHVSLEHPEYRETPSLKKTIVDVKSKRERLAQDPNVLRTAERITGHVMLATAKENFGAFFIAFDPTAEDKDTLSIIEGLSEGKLFETAKDKGIVLGRKLAANLGLTLGKKVVYTVTDKQGEIVSELARVVGIVETGAPSVDRGLCMFPIDTMRQTLGYGPDEATLIAAFIEDQRDSRAVAERVTPDLSGDTAALTWKESQPELDGFITMKVTGTLFFEILVMILVAAGIFNTLFVSVMERMREFGIMMALGFSPGKLFALVMWESLWLGLVGLVAAVVVTAGPYYYLNQVGIDFSKMVGSGTEIAGVAVQPVFYVGIYPENAILILGAVLVATLASGLYPAWKAGRVVPVETIKLV